MKYGNAGTATDKGHAPHVRPQAGFTLVELVAVIIILGILAALALPRFVNLASEARKGAVETLAGAIVATTNTVYAKCAVSPNCSVNSDGMTFTIDGTPYWITYGYVDAGDVKGTTFHGGVEIDLALNHSGFTVSTPSTASTRFTRADAKDPGHCYVEYGDAWSHGKMYTLTKDTTGC